MKGRRPTLSKTGITAFLTETKSAFVPAVTSFEWGQNPLTNLFLFLHHKLRYFANENPYSSDL